VSVLAAAGLVAAKLCAGLLTNSLAIYSEAGHSAVDLLAALVSYVAIYRAGQPPDDHHHFGHAKFESIGALTELLFLLALGGAIVYNAVRRLLFGTPEITITWVAVALVTLTITIDVWRTTALHRAARRTGSEALAASAMHFLSDLLGTSMVMFGLLMTALGYPKADSMAALVIAGLVLYLSYRLGRRVLSSLTDRAPRGISVDVEDLVSSIRHVIGVHDIRVRQAGAQYFAEMHVDLSPTISLEQAHDVLDQIEEELRKRYPGMHVVTHPEPFGEGLDAPAESGTG
jgi:cation diffusion facilitator family transporter